MNNEQEWRALLLSEIKEVKADVGEVKNEIMTLKIKVAGFASLIGSAASVIWHKFFN